MDLNDNNIYLLEKSNEKFNSLHSTYKWGNYISNNLTFDDNLRSQIKYGIPILKK